MINPNIITEVSTAASIRKRFEMLSEITGAQTSTRRSLAATKKKTRPSAGGPMAAGATNTCPPDCGGGLAGSADSKASDKNFWRERLRLKLSEAGKEKKAPKTSHSLRDRSKADKIDRKPNDSGAPRDLDLSSPGVTVPARSSIVPRESGNEGETKEATTVVIRQRNVHEGDVYGKEQLLEPAEVVEETSVIIQTFSRRGRIRSMLPLEIKETHAIHRSLEEAWPFEEKRLPVLERPQSPRNANGGRSLPESSKSQPFATNYYEDIDNSEYDEVDAQSNSHSSSSTYARSGQMSNGSRSEYRIQETKIRKFIPPWQRPPKGAHQEREAGDTTTSDSSYSSSSERERIIDSRRASEEFLSAPEEPEFRSERTRSVDSRAESSEGKIVPKEKSNSGNNARATHSLNISINLVTSGREGASGEHQGEDSISVISMSISSSSVNLDEVPSGSNTAEAAGATVPQSVPYEIRSLERNSRGYEFVESERRKSRGLDRSMCTVSTLTSGLIDDTFGFLNIYELRTGKEWEIDE